MRKEYDLQTDVLTTIIATTPVVRKHAELLTAFATRTDYYLEQRVPRGHHR